MLLALPIPPGNITPVWPPAAIAWVSILLLGYRVAPAIWIADFVGSVTNNFEVNHNLILAIAFTGVGSLGATVEAVLGAYLLQRFIGDRYLFDRSEDVFKFAIIALFCPTLNAFIGVCALCLGGFSGWNDFGSLWRTWWIGNAISLLIFTPAMLTWVQRFPQQFKSHQWIEAFTLLIILLSVGRMAFGLGYPMEYLLIPCLVWANFRFGQFGGTSSTVLAVNMALWGTVKGVGSFVHPSLNKSLILLQTFIGTAAVTTLIVGAVLKEREGFQTALTQANEELEAKVEERTAKLQQSNEHLAIEIVERQQIERVLRESKATLQKQAEELEAALQELKQTQSQLVQTEKMSSLGQLVAGVAHEINNPVSFIYGNLNHVNNYTKDILGLLKVYEQSYPNTSATVQEFLNEIDLDFLREDLPKTLHSMQVGTERIREIVLSLRNFSRLDEADFKAANIHEGIDNTLMILQHRLKTQTKRPEIQIIKEYAQLPLVLCSAGQLNQVFMNLIINAIDALDESFVNCQSVANARISGKEKLTIKIPTIFITTQLTGKKQVLISIADNGVGIPKEVRSKLFDPFFTTKPVGKGTGLGLSISYQIIVEKHGGKLWCDSTLGQGTKFLIQIPIQQS